MKKVFPLLSTSTGAPLTGRQITLVRVLPDDGAEVACSELAAPGTYLANSINAGLYKVFDRTGGAIPGTDLDQVVDVAAATLMQPSLAGAASGFLAAPDKTFRAIGKADISGLNTDLGALQTSVNNAGNAIMAEANTRLTEDAKIKADVLASVSALNSTLVNTVTGIVNADSKNGLKDLSHFVNLNFVGSAIDYAGGGTSYKSYVGGSNMIFVSAGALCVPLDIIPESVKAALKTRVVVGTVNSNSFDNPVGLEGGTMTSVTAPAIGVTERIRELNVRLLQSSAGTGRAVRAFIDVMQSADFDSVMYLNFDVTGIGLLVSQFSEFKVWIFDKDQGGYNSCLNFDVADLFNQGKSRFAIRLKRASGTLLCSKMSIPYSVMGGA